MFGGAYKSHNQFATRLFTRLFARGEPSQIKLNVFTFIIFKKMEISNAYIYKIPKFRFIIKIRRKDFYERIFSLKLSFMEWHSKKFVTLYVIHTRISPLHCKRSFDDVERVNCQLCQTVRVRRRHVCT